MSEFEFLRNVTVGQYLPTGSPIHRLDPRAKLLAFVVLLLAAILAPGIAGALAFLAVMLALTVVARIPVGYALRGVLPAMPFIVTLALFQLFAPPVAATATCAPLVEWGFLGITSCGVSLVFMSMLRFLGLILLVSLLTMTTSVTELAHGIEVGLRPWQRVGIPAHELSLVATIAIRFVPTLAEEMERLAKAQAARGADFGTGAAGFVTRIRRLIPLFVPLITSSLRRADALTEAMETRAYLGGGGRSHYVDLDARPTDWVAVGAAVALAAALLLGPWAAIDAGLWARVIG